MSSTTSAIVSAGYAYPSERVDNATYLARCRFPIGDGAELARETRMHTRTWCTDEENTWTMARAAARMALEGAGAAAADIDLVIVASGTTMPIAHPAQREQPGMADLAPLVIRELGLRALGFDVKACYCTGFLRGLELADALLAAGRHRAALVIASEQGSRFAVAESNRSTFCFIMSDAAGAVVLRRSERAPGVGIVAHTGYTAADKLDWVGIGPDAASTVMMGTRAAGATHEMLVECARGLLAQAPARPRWLLPIQTHARVVEGLQRALEWPDAGLLWTGDVTGFAGSASIPACFAEQRAAGTIRPGELVLAVAVGAGMNCAGALFHA